MVNGATTTTGFRVVPRKDALDFTGTDLEGAVVTARIDVSMATFVEMQRLIEAIQPEDMRRLPELATRWGEDVLLEWDLEDQDGNAFPSTGEGMCLLPGRIALIIIAAWSQLLQEVPAPLDETSGDGSMSEEALTVLADASSSLVNSNAPD